MTTPAEPPEYRRQLDTEVMVPDLDVTGQARYVPSTEVTDPGKSPNEVVNNTTRCYTARSREPKVYEGFVSWEEVPTSYFRASSDDSEDS